MQGERIEHRNDLLQVGMHRLMVGRHENQIAPFAPESVLSLSIVGSCISLIDRPQFGQVGFSSIPVQHLT
jgi:hypothetical protein